VKGQEGRLVLSSGEVGHYLEERTGGVIEMRARPKIGPFPRSDILTPMAALKREFGEFRVDVYDSQSDARHDAMANGEADEMGIHWTWIAPEHVGDQGIWLGAKVYANVALFWWNETRTVDRRWRRLDTIMRDVVATHSK
jgi:hypothetical protein